MALIVAFVVAVVTAPAAARVARPFGIVDRPGPLKVHQEPVPYLGGAAVLLAVAGPVAWVQPELLIPLVLAFALGLADDAASLRPDVRLGAEIVIGVATAVVVPTRGLGGAAMTVVAVVVLLNAVNLLDGLDGLAAGVGIVSALGFAALLDGDFSTCALALAGALAGVLVWNRPPARIYLGDAGSYLVGTALAALLVASNDAGTPAARTSGALLLVAVPVADTAVAILRRVRAKRPLFQGDRGHIYDQIVDRGHTPVAAVLACVAAQAVLVVVGLVIAELSGAVAVAITAGVIVAVGAVLIGVFTSPRSWAS